MMPSEEYTFLTSTMVKEVASFGGSVKGLVPDVVEKALKKKFK
jgi:pantetheine-phosphate adenylyltransferase